MSMRPDRLRQFREESRRYKARKQLEVTVQGHMNMVMRNPILQISGIGAEDDEGESPEQTAAAGLHSAEMSATGGVSPYTF